MHSKLIVRRIVELYQAVNNELKAKTQKNTSKAQIPMLHLDIDERYGKPLRQSFIAMRIQFVDNDFKFKSYLLSLRHFDRSKFPTDLMRASGILYDWTWSVLREFELDTLQFFSATTDSGSDVRYMCKTLLGVEWEWYIPHMLTNAIKESYGMMSSQRSYED